MSPGSHTNRAARAWFVPVAVLVVGAVVSGLAYTWPGQPASVDIWPHLVRQAAVYNALRTGTSPFWSFDFYCGFPLLRFYTPLFALLSGTLSLAFGGGHVAAMKFLLFVLHLLSGVTMFLYLRRRTSSFWAAAVGTLAYLAVPWRIFHLAVLANNPQALVYLLLPVVFHAFERMRDRGDLRSALLFGLSLGLLALSHLLYLLFTVVLLAVVLAARPVADSAPVSARRRFAMLAIGCISALLVSAFFTVPFLAEFSARIYPHADVVLPRPELSFLLNPRSRPGGYQGAYLGISIVLATLASATGIVLSRSRRPRSLWVVLGLVLSLLFVFGTGLLGAFGNRLFFGLPGTRFLLFVVFFSGILVAEGIGLLEQAEKVTAWSRVVVPAALAVVICIDCLPHAFRVRDYFTGKKQLLAGRESIYAALGQEPTARVLDLPDHEDRVDNYLRLDGPPAMNHLYGGLGSPFGPPYGQFAPRAMLYVYPWLNSVAQELGDASTLSLSARARKALALSGISHVITLPTRDDTGGRAVARVKGGIDWSSAPPGKPGAPPTIVGKTGNPLVLSSTRLVPLEEAVGVKARSIIVASDWRELLDTLEIDAEAGTIDFVPARSGAAQTARGPAGLDVIGQEVRADRVLVDFAARGECFVRLAVSYYPELRLLLDGRPADFGETADHFTWFRCPEGRHTISVSAPAGTLRQICAAISLLSVLVCAGLLVFLRPKAAGEPGR